MRRFFCAGILIILFVSGITGVNKAEMVNTRIDKLIMDDITGLVWYKDVASFRNLTYQQQIESISLLESSYDVDGDGHLDKLSWRIATYSDANDLVFNYHLDSEISREEFMANFNLTRYEVYGNIAWDEEIWGRIGTDSTYGYFKLFQNYLYYPTVTSPDYVHDPYGNGEVEVTGPFDSQPPDDLALDDLGAWAVAEVDYGPIISAAEPNLANTDNVEGGGGGGCFIVSIKMN